MFAVNSLPVAIAFCAVTMLGWGSWANTQKLAGQEQWPFQLFYWDYAIGVFLCSLVFAGTLGTFGRAGEGEEDSAVEKRCQGSGSSAAAQPSEIGRACGDDHAHPDGRSPPADHPVPGDRRRPQCP